MKKKSNFSGQIGFVLAAAGSAAGVGNLWRFLLFSGKRRWWSVSDHLYRFGADLDLPLLTTDIAIGRKRCRTVRHSGL